MNNDRLRILDIVNTDHAALNFLAFRVGWMNRNTEFQNDIVCSPGPHLRKLGMRGAVVTPMDIPRGLSPVNLTKLLQDMVKFLRANHYTIVHTHNSVTGAVGRIAARIARVPLIIHTTHGFHFHENMGRLERIPYITAERWLSKCCDVLLCQNRQELDDVRRLGLWPKQGVYHVGNGINMNRFKRRASAPHNERPVILCVARFEPVKNHGQLFEALRILRQQYNHNPQVLLVGDGPLRARYETQLREMGLAENVQILGYRYDIPELNADADIAVLTSVKEGIPRSVMEAMASGVPVVATDVKGTREVITDGHTGCLVQLGDAAGLAAKLAWLIDRPARREEMGNRGAEHIRRHFDEERVVERLAWIYRSALHARGLAPARHTDPTPLHAENRA